MKINFNRPKYIIPLLNLPFIIFFFSIYRKTIEQPKVMDKKPGGIQDQIGTASPDVQKSAFDDKLEAFNEQYKESDGNTAVNPIDDDAHLDSIDYLVKQRFAEHRPSSFPQLNGASVQQQGLNRLSQQDQELAKALASIQNGSGTGSPYAAPYYNPTPNTAQQQPAVKEKDPMDLFKAQMAYMDSVTKASDPEYKAEQQRIDVQNKADELRKQQPKLAVQKETNASSVFNTLLPGKKEEFITAIIDENVTGYSGSRIRLRLLEDIRVGQTPVKKGTYLFALITGFGDQRVSLTVQSIFLEGKILPVKLELYDTDGLPGLYVPESAFREFSKDLGGNSMQGVNLQGNNAHASQFLMSSFDKVFQSTSAAIANLIRKNKAKIKYNSYIYLIDPQALQNEQKNY
jgi:conjugative transposon TraM protein